MMRKLFQRRWASFNFLLVALMTMCNCGCNREEQTIPEVDTIELQATAGNQTKVGFDQDGHFFWSERDRIGVVLSSAPDKFSSMKLVDGAGTPGANFSMTGKGTLGEFAVYPFSSLHKLAGSELTFHIPETLNQSVFEENLFTGDPAKRPSTSTPMWGRVQDGKARFYHLGGVFFVEMKVLPATDFTIEISADQRLAGDFKVDLGHADLDHMPVICSDGGEKGRVLTRNVTNSQKQTSGVFYFPVPTGKFTNVNLTVKDAEGKVFSHKHYDGFEVKRCNLVMLSGPEFANGPAPVLPKREVRGAWIQTLYNNCWPSAYSWGSIEQQKIELDELISHMKAMNINVLFFQVRSMADLFYESEYEPWSKVLTGARGKNPGWDPIAYAIEKAHKSNMQLHAWINPYRIQNKGDKPYPAPVDGKLDGKIPYELVKDYAGIRMYNPALPEARQRIADIIDEMLRKYPELDGVHFDDYFYPSSGQCGGNYADDEEFQKYGVKGQSIEEFRRENVNKMVVLIRETVKKRNPECIFTISPSGNVEYNYNSMFADVARWCQEKWVDAIIPQLYWDRTYFDDRLDQFCKLAADTPIMVGFGTCYFQSPANPDRGWNDFDDPEVFRAENNLALSQKQVVGGVHFTSSSLVANKVGIGDMVKSCYPYPVFPLYLGQNPQVLKAPSQLVLDGKKLSWQGNDAKAEKYAIYQLLDTPDPNGANLKMIGWTKGTKRILPAPGIFYVTALDKYNSESPLSEAIEYK